MQGAKQTILLESVHRLLRRGAALRVQHLLEKTRPVDIAHLFPACTPRERQQVFELLKSPQVQAQVLAEAERGYVPELFAGLTVTKVVEILKGLGTDDVADILRALPEDQSEPILRAMHDKESYPVEEILGYGPETAGGIMSADYFALNRDITIADAIRTLQEKGEEVEMAFYVYVINEHSHLVGVLSLRQLVTTRPDRKLIDVMEPDVISVRTEADQEEVAALVARYNWLAVPVVDESNKLRGIVTVDDIIDVIKDEATEDILKLAGAGQEVAPEAPAREHLKMRYPWLISSCISGFIAAILLDNLIGTVGAFLGAFVPMVTGMSGNVGVQSSTVIVRGLATGQVDSSRALSVVRRELLIGLIMGACYGLIVGCVAALYSVWHGAAVDGIHILWFGVSVSLALLFGMLIAASMGTMVPIALSKFGFDPAVATGPFVTSSLDVLGNLSFFAVAYLLARAFGIALP